MSDPTVQLGVAAQQQAAAASSKPSESGNTREARLVSVPDEVRAETREARALVRVRGEVVRARGDGSVRIQSERGTIDVQVSGDQPPPKVGQRVEVDIPVSRPAPQQSQSTPPPAVEGSARPPELTQTPPRPTNTAPQSAPPKLPETVILRVLPQGQPAAAPSRATATPIEVQIQPAPPNGLMPPVQPAALAPPANGLPPEGSYVRLTPLPPDIASALPVPQPLQIIVSSLIESVTARAVTIAQESVTALNPPLPNAEPITTSPAKPTITPPILSPLQPAVAKIVAPALPILETPSAGAASALPPQILVDAPPKLDAPALLPGASAKPLVLSTLPSAQVLTAAPQNLIKPADTLPAPAVITGTLDKATLPPAQFFNGEGQFQPPNFESPAPDRIHTKPESLILNNQKAGNISGVVTNITPATVSPASQPVISVYFPQTQSIALFTLPPSVESVSIGTQIQITPSSVFSSSAASTLTAATPLSSVPLPIALAPMLHWPVMEDIAETLAHIAPQTAQAMMNVTPSPANPAQMGPAMMFFVAALRGGDLGQWLGDKAQDLLRSAGKTGALSKLSQEGSFLNRAAREPSSQEWRSMNLPMAWGADIQKIALHYRHEREASEDEDHKGIKSTRFVFDLALENMGKVQVDGLFHPAGGRSDSGRLDVALRTEDHFSEATRAEMRRVYARALRDTDITGELSFQGKAAQWVTIQADDKDAMGVNA